MDGRLSEMQNSMTGFKTSVGKMLKYQEEEKRNSPENRSATSLRDIVAQLAEFSVKMNELLDGLERDRQEHRENIRLQTAQNDRLEKIAERTALHTRIAIGISAFSAFVAAFAAAVAVFSLLR